VVDRFTASALYLGHEPRKDDQRGGQHDQTDRCRTTTGAHRYDVSYQTDERTSDSLAQRLAQRITHCDAM